MKSAIEYFVKYPIMANIIVFLTVILGCAAMFNTQKSFFPKQPVRNIIIQVVYPGASPQEMEEGVTLKIEEAVYSIQGIDEITSTSSENMASIDVKTLSGYDIDEIYADVKTVDDLPVHLLSSLQHFFEHYKDLEDGKWVKVEGWHGPELAIKEIMDSIERFSATK